VLATSTPTLPGGSARRVFEAEEEDLPGRPALVSRSFPCWTAALPADDDLTILRPDYGRVGCCAEGPAVGRRAEPAGTAACWTAAALTIFIGAAVRRRAEAPSLGPCAAFYEGWEPADQPPPPDLQLLPGV
jgi:hypothetical protein